MGHYAGLVSSEASPLSLGVCVCVLNWYALPLLICFLVFEGLTKFFLPQHKPDKGLMQINKLNQPSTTV